jgi:murein DD-endopeptidase MepM/ murein hydrolase activator NlpD
VKKLFLLFLGGLIIIILVAAYFAFRSPFGATVGAGRHQKVIDWIRNPFDHGEWVIQAGERCANAPFIFPTTGFIGYLWGDSFRPGHEHQGLDIFGGTDVGETVVIAAYDGYLTRLPDWKSTLIIRIPSDPLAPGNQIWTYYTHLADKEGNSFISEQVPPGSYEIFVPAGTILGYQGNYSGTPGNPTGVHLHFSIVKDDGSGGFLNELKIVNTIDPSPYFEMNLNAIKNDGAVPGCNSLPVEADG